MSKPTKRPIEVLTPAEVKRLLDALPDTWTGHRNRAIFVVLYRTGMRIAEALSMVPRDVDLKRKTLNVRHGKGDEQRVVPICGGGAAVLQDWLEERREWVDDDATYFHDDEELSSPVFPTFKGTRLDSSHLRGMLPELKAKAGIKKRVHLHGLRHTFASELVDEGVDIRIISQQLGHLNSATTARYVDHLNPKRVIDVIGKREWTA